MISSPGLSARSLPCALTESVFDVIPVVCDSTTMVLLRIELDCGLIVVGVLKDKESVGGSNVLSSLDFRSVETGDSSSSMMLFGSRVVPYLLILVIVIAVVNLGLS